MKLESLKPHRVQGHHRGFTLIEVMVSSVIFIVIVALVTGMMNAASSLWLRHRSQAAAFGEANAAFEAVTRTLAQALLNTYWEVQGTRYGRASELHFIMGPAAALLGGSTASTPGDAVFFQAALGRPANSSLKRLPYLLNSVGYFVQFDAGPPAPAFLEPFIQSRYRFRLYEWIQPSENFEVYSSNANPNAWFTNNLGSMDHTAVLAENVIGLILMAEYPDTAGNITPTYDYNSRHTASPETLNQLPPRIRVVMAVIDEPSAQRLADQSGTTPPAVYPEATWFQNPANFDDDLTEWESRLASITPRIEYRIFTATVSIQNAKWSLSL